MVFTQGFAVSNVDAARDNAAKTKPQYHRPGVTFQPEGFVFTMSEASQTKNVDYSPLTFTTNLNGAVTTGATTIVVNSVWGLAESQDIVIDAAGTNETKQIRSIDAATKTVTLTAALENDHADDVTVEMDRVHVSYDGDTKITTVDLVIAGQNADASLAGSDIQFGYAHAAGDGFNALDSCCGKIIVPYWTGSSFIEIFGGYMCRGQYAVAGQDHIEINAHESASAIDPDYILRIEFQSQEETPTEKQISINLGVWRA